MTFILSGILLRFTGFERTVTCEGSTVAAALDQLVARYPDLREVLFDRFGKLTGAHQLWVNGQQMVGDYAGRELGEKDEVEILTLVAGG